MIGFQELVALLIAFACGAWAVRWFIHSMKGSESCGCGKKGCGNKGEQEKVQIQSPTQER